MPTPQQIRDAVDSRLATLWGAVQTREASYMAAHNGRAWQGLRTHSIPPADGATTLPDIGTACPTDQPGAPWPAGIRTTAIEMALQIDAYQSPLGDGYQGTVWVTIGGTTWTRTAQVGPETQRATNWAQVDTTPIIL